MQSILDISWFIFEINLCYRFSFVAIFNLLDSAFHLYKDDIWIIPLNTTVRQLARSCYAENSTTLIG